MPLPWQHWFAVPVGVKPNHMINLRKINITVSDWPSLILFTADRMDSICAGDRRACIDVESHTMPKKVVLCSGENRIFFWCLAVTPTLSCGPERHLDAALPTDATELESTNCSMYFVVYNVNTLSRRGTRAASTYFVKVRGDNARPNGRTRYWYALPPKANLRNLLWQGRMDMWKYAFLRSIMTNQSSDLICGTICLKVNILNLSFELYDGVIQNSKI